MGRYSPTVVPEVPDPLDVVQSMWSGYLGYKQGQRAEEGLELEKEALDIRKQEAGVQAEERELDRYERGFRRGPVPKRVPDENLPSLLRSGAKVFGQGPQNIGLQPGERQGAPGLQDQLKQARGQYEPQIVAKPGALVPGTNVFAQRPVTTADFQQPVAVPDERYQQVTEDVYFDPSGTREARMLDRQQRYEDFRQSLAQTYDDQELRRRVQALVAAGVDPNEATVEAMGMDIPGRTTSGSRPWDAMTMNQALDEVRREAITWEVDEMGEYTGAWHWNPGWNQSRLFNEARKLSKADYSSYPMDEGYEGGVLGGRYLEPPVSFQDYINRYRTDPFNVRQGEPTETPPETESPWTDEDIAEARELVSDMEREEAIIELQDLGFSAADIRRIIGG